MAKVWNQNAAKIDLEMQSSKAISTNQNLNSKQYEQKNYFACFWWEINKIVRKSSCITRMLLFAVVWGGKRFWFVEKTFLLPDFPHLKYRWLWEKLLFDWNALLAWAQWAGWSQARKMRHRNIGRGNNLQEN